MKTSLIAAAAVLLATTFATTGCTESSISTDASSKAEQAEKTEKAAEELAPHGKISLTKNFYFVFDGSGSMKTLPAGESSGKTKIDGAKWAVLEFLKKVPRDVNLGLYVFDDRGRRQVLPLGPNNRAQFIAAVDNVDAGDSTPLGEAIRQGAEALASQYKQQLGYGEYRLIVITDGDATDSLDKGVREAQRHKIPIYTIGFDMPGDHELRKHSVSYRAADSAKEVEKALEEAAAELDVFDQTAFRKSANKSY